MGIWGRLNDLINSYVNDMIGDQNIDKSFTFNKRKSHDPDLDSAYDELEDYLNYVESGGNKKNQYSGSQQTERQNNSTGDKEQLPPEELRQYFECLGVPFGADEQTCKAAYKNLLKIHHPDMHVNHEGNYKKATAKSAKINDAWDKIEKWRTTKK